MKRMEGYASIHFKWETEEEIQEMYQFICGECYLYIDSLVTWDEKDAKLDSERILEFMTGFFEMLAAWLKLIPKYSKYYAYMEKYPYLYMVWNEAAILNLSKSFITSLEMIFGVSPRGEEFRRTASYILPKTAQVPSIKNKKLHAVS